MIAPAVILFLLYIIIPVFMSFYYGFTNFTGIGKPEFLGLRNYITLFSDKIFYIALKNTGLVLAMSLLLIVPCSFGLSLLFARKMRGGKLVKAFCFSPNIISPILIGLIWVFILDPKIGLINAFLRYIGVAAQPEWIGGKTLTPYCVGAIFLWQTLGYNATIFLAGIKMVLQELYEASEIDGASQFKIFGSIILPLGKPIAVTMALFSGLSYWNDWTNGLYYLTGYDGEKLYSIQNFLNKVVTDIQYLNSSQVGSNSDILAKLPTVSVRMAIAFVAMIPILVLFPFLQKYFSKGIAMGAVKG